MFFARSESENKKTAFKGTVTELVNSNMALMRAKNIIYYVLEIVDRMMDLTSFPRFLHCSKVNVNGIPFSQVFVTVYKSFQFLFFIYVISRI